MNLYITARTIEDAKKQCEKMGLYLSSKPVLKPAASVGHDSIYDITTLDGTKVGDYTQFAKSHSYSSLQDCLLINKEMYLAHRIIPI